MTRRQIVMKKTVLCSAKKPAGTYVFHPDRRFTISCHFLKQYFEDCSKRRAVLAAAAMRRWWYGGDPVPSTGGELHAPPPRLRGPRARKAAAPCPGRAWQAKGVKGAGKPGVKTSLGWRQVLAEERSGTEGGGGWGARSKCAHRAVWWRWRVDGLSGAGGLAHSTPRPSV